MKTKKDWVQWIVIISFLLLGIAIGHKCSAQVSFNLSGGTSYSDEVNYFIGCELQGSNVSVTTTWHPQRLEKYFYVNGFSLKATYYLWAYQTTPYFSMGVVTHGN